MKKIVFLLALTFAASACTRVWNDIAHAEVYATITAFEIEGQAKCDIIESSKEISLLLPYDAEITALTLKQFAYTEGATCTPALKAGDKIDLSSPLTITLTTYDDYVWKVTATLKPKPLNDIYNMTFDTWSKDYLGLDACYGEGADAEQKKVWGSVNSYLGMFSFPIMWPETSFVAVPGEGKAAVKLQSRGIEALKLFAGGSIFTGEVISYSQAEFIAKMGYPFAKRPKTLEGHVCYQPKAIDWCTDAYKDKKGNQDKGFIFVLLADWTEPYEVNPPAKLLDTGNVPGVIGYGKVDFDKPMEAYEKFSLEIKYLNDNTPKHVVILATASELGDYFTGAEGSVLYLDDLGFTY